MAIPTPPPQIGSLDFKEIKQNLINYLQGQSIIRQSGSVQGIHQRGPGQEH